MKTNKISVMLLSAALACTPILTSTAQIAAFAEETTTQNAAETQGQPKAAKEKGAWKKTAKKVAKIAIPVAGGIALGVIGTELAIKKPWKKSKKSSSAPRLATPKSDNSAKK